MLQPSAQGHPTSTGPLPAPPRTSRAPGLPPQPEVPLQHSCDNCPQVWGQEPVPPGWAPPALLPWADPSAGQSSSPVPAGNPHPSPDRIPAGCSHGRSGGRAAQESTRQGCCDPALPSIWKATAPPPTNACPPSATASRPGHLAHAPPPVPCPCPRLPVAPSPHVPTAPVSSCLTGWTWLLPTQRTPAPGGHCSSTTGNTLEPIPMETKDHTMPPL